MHRAKIPVQDYAALAGQFNPAKFNAEEWVGVAKGAGGEVYRHHGEASRWVRDVSLEVQRLWWDTPEAMTKEEAELFMAALKKQPGGDLQQQPVGRGFQGGGIQTLKQSIPATGQPGADWEARMMMNDTWGYKATDFNWEPEPVGEAVGEVTAFPPCSAAARAGSRIAEEGFPFCRRAALLAGCWN